MNELMDLQTRENSARLVLAQHRLEGAAAVITWPRKIDPAANGKADEVRTAIEAYLQRLLSLLTDFPDAVRYKEREAALKRTRAKLIAAHAHRPMLPEKMLRHGIEIPDGYDYSDELYRWANDVIGPLHEKRISREQALEHAKAAYEQVKPQIEQRIEELRADAARINVLLHGIAAKRPPAPRFEPAPPRPQRVSIETKRTPTRRKHSKRREASDTYVFPPRKEKPVPFRHDRLQFDAVPEPPRTGVVPVDEHVILVGAFPR